MPIYANFAERILAYTAARRAAAAGRAELAKRLGLPLLMQREENERDRQHAIRLEQMRTDRESRQQENEARVRRDIAEQDIRAKLTIAGLREGRATRAEEKGAKPADYTESRSGKRYAFFWDGNKKVWTKRLIGQDEPDKPPTERVFWVTDPISGQAILMTASEVKAQNLQPWKEAEDFSDLFPVNERPALEQLDK